MKALALEARASAPPVVALFAVTVLAALLIRVLPGGPDAIRASLALGFDPPPGSLAGAAGTLGTNGRVAGAMLLLAQAVRGRLLPPWPARLLAAAVLGLNAALVGAAIGAYGPAATLPWLPHLPLEWAALGISASPLLRPAAAATPFGAAALAAACLAAAAALEEYATPLSS